MDGHRTGFPQGAGEQNPAYRPTHHHIAVELAIYQNVFDVAEPGPVDRLAVVVREDQTVVTDGVCGRVYCKRIDHDLRYRDDAMTRFGLRWSEGRRGPLQLHELGSACG